MIISINLIHWIYLYSELSSRQGMTLYRTIKKYQLKGKFVIYYTYILLDDRRIHYFFWFLL